MIGILIAATLLAQQAPAPIAAKPRVEGVVINSLNGEAVRKGTVILRAADDDHAVSYADETDGNGHFSIDDVEPGEYAVFAEHPGFFLQPSGATGAPPPGIKVQKDQEIKDVTIRLTPLGVISGRVLDADGDPVRGARVQALRYVYTDGKKELRNVEQAQSGQNGEFRIFGLRAGTFYLRATGVQKGMAKLARAISTYYPGATDETHAAPVELRAGIQLRGFDIRLQSTASFAIRFELSEADQAQGLPAILLLNAQGFVPGLGPIYTGTGFLFSGVPPGLYQVVAIRQLDGATPSYAARSVEVVNADVDGGTLNLAPGTDILGSVRVEGGAFSGLETLRINLRSQPVLPLIGANSAEVKPDGSFLLKAAAPGVHEVSINRTSGVYLKAVRLGDKVMADRRIEVPSKVGPLTVVLGVDVGQVEGSVQNASGEPMVRARVNVIPYGNNLGRNDLAQLGFTDEKGEFKIKDVAPGDYKVFAWEDVPVSAPQDADFRKPFEKQAAALRMQPNGHEKVQLTAIAADATKSADQ